MDSCDTCHVMCLTLLRDNPTAGQESSASTIMMPDKQCRPHVMLQGQLYLREAGLRNQTPSP